MPREMDMNNLTDEDKAWLRSWNRGHEIPGDDGSQSSVAQELVPGNPPVSTPVAPTVIDGPPEADPFNGEDPPEDYNDWTNKQLEWELGNRSLPKSGNKDALVARLVEDDANDDEDED